MALRRRETIRRDLRMKRASVGLSQLAVADKVGIPERRYWLIENGYDAPSPEVITKLAKLFKVEPSEMPWTPPVVASEAKAS